MAEVEKIQEEEKPQGTETNSNLKVVKKKKKRKNKKSILAVMFEILLALVIGVLVGTFVSKNLVGKSTVNGKSMEPTYQTGDELLVSKLYVIPSRGDVITLDVNGMSIVKRVVATPGDYIKIENSQLFVNGAIIEEPYILEEEYFGGIVEGTTIKLESGEYFVLGDNRNNSLDSREFGAVSEDTFTGMVLLKLEKQYTMQSILDTIRDLIVFEFKELI